MRFAGARRPECYAVRALLDPLAAHELQNQRLVQRRFSREVERIEALGLRKERQANATLYVTTLAINALQFAKAQQIARVIGAILRRFHGDFFILARECGKLQGLEVCSAALGAQRSPAL